MWEAFAEATAALPGGTESDVAAAGLRGALDVFGARRVEIEVRAADGVDRYAEDGPGMEYVARRTARAGDHPPHGGRPARWSAS